MARSCGIEIVDLEQLIQFMEENIMSRFGVPENLITNNGSIFVGSKFTAFCGKFGILMGQSLIITLKVMV
jgi:hypothetical protein